MSIATSNGAIKKEVVSSLTIEEIEGLHNSIMGSRAHYRAIANAAATRERQESIEWIRKAYPQFDEAVFINLENR